MQEIIYRFVISLELLQSKHSGLITFSNATSDISTFSPQSRFILLSSSELDTEKVIALTTALPGTLDYITKFRIYRSKSRSTKSHSRG
jgi:hypothetical protein